MASFATPTDMGQRSQGAITATTHPFVQQELDAATRTIRNECGWHIATVETLTRKRRSAFWEPIWIPAMEITAVKIITLDEVENILADDEFDPDTGWTSWSGDRYTLEYTAGFTTVPEDIVTLTLELAAGALGMSLGISRAQAGGVSVTYARAGGGLTADDKNRLAAYRIGRLP
jgi:hypothetical protein